MVVLGGTPRGGILCAYVPDTRAIVQNLAHICGTELVLINHGTNTLETSYDSTSEINLIAHNV